MAIAQGQITIVDYNDALSLTAHIGSSVTKTQMYNPDNGKYTPDWSAQNITLKPSLFKTGSGSNIITQAESVKWFDTTNGSEVAITGSEAAYTISTNNLVIKDNVMAGKPGKTYMVEITYMDPRLNEPLTVKTDISFSRVVNGSGIADAIAWLPDGNIFKNDEPASLTAQCDFWRGSLIDTTDVTYQWYQKDPTQGTDVGGGVGWKKLTNVSGRIQGATTNLLTVYKEAVLNYAIFKCVIKDADSTSNSFEQEFVDTVTMADQSDPIQVVVESPKGNVMKNGQGSVDLIAKLYRQGEALDPNGTDYVYMWYKYDNAGDLVTGWGGATDYKTGQSITVQASDVTVTGTFKVLVEK